MRKRKRRQRRQRRGRRGRREGALLLCLLVAQSASESPLFSLPLLLPGSFYSRALPRPPSSFPVQHEETRDGRVQRSAVQRSAAAICRFTSKVSSPPLSFPSTYFSSIPCSLLSLYPSIHLSISPSATPSISAPLSI